MYIVINGGGKVGSFLATTLIRNRHDVAVIERREEVAERLAAELPAGALIIRGDGCDDAFQRDAGVGRADIFASVTGDDSDNLVACRVAQVAFGVPRTVGRVNNPKNERIFRELGIEPVSSTTIIARVIEREVDMGDIHTLASLRKGNLAIVEIALPQEGSPVFGRRVADLSLPLDCVLVAVVRGDEVLTVRGHTQMQAGDVVIAFTRVQDERVLKRALTGE